MKLRILTTLAMACVMVATTLIAEEKKVVLLYGPRSHGPGDHEFKAGSHLLANHLNAQKKFPVNAVVHGGWPEDESILDDADAIVIYDDATRVVGKGWEKMDALTKKGVGLLLMHYAVHPTIEKGEQYFLPWIGGYFRNQHSVNPFWAADIKMLKGHPVSQGVGKICCIDEFYFNLKYAEKMIPLGVAIPDETNLHHINNLWTASGAAQKGKEQALLWGFERPNGSRGAGFTGGHNHENWAYDSYRVMILNTIAWIAGADVPEGGVPSFKVTEDALNENLDDYGERNKRILLPSPKDLEFERKPWRMEPNKPRVKKNKKK